MRDVRSREIVPKKCRNFIEINSELLVLLEYVKQTVKFHYEVSMAVL
jgi:hypothetical protein